MNSKQKKQASILVLFFISAAFFGHWVRGRFQPLQQIKRNPAASNSEQNSYPQEGATQGLTGASSCFTMGVGEEAHSYYTGPAIVQKGKPSGVLAWSSSEDSRLSHNQEIFTTSSRFNLRLVAMPSPGKGQFAEGVTCKFLALPYTKLQAKIRLRSSESKTFFKEFLVEEIPVNGCSKVYEFTPPASKSPWVVEIYDVKWDYSCIQYQAGGFSDVPQCPWDNVWENDCYEMALQWSTDQTKNFETALP